MKTKQNKPNQTKREKEAARGRARIGAAWNDPLREYCFEDGTRMLLSRSLSG